LGKEAFGELGIIQNTSGMFGVFAGFGLGLTSTKYVAEFRAKEPGRAGRIIALSAALAWAAGLLAAAVMWIAAPWLAERTLAAPQLTPALRISSLLALLGGVNGAQTGALSGFESFKTIAWVNLLAGLASFPLVLIGTRCGGLHGTIWGLVGSLAVNAALSNLALRRQCATAGVPLFHWATRRDWDVLWRFSLPAVLSSAMVVPAYWACSAIVVNQPGGYGEMGVFNAANQWFSALLFLPMVLSQAAMPVLSERLGNNDTASTRDVLRSCLKTNIIVVSPLILAAGIGSPYIMASYGTGFAGAWPTFVVVLSTAGVLAVLTPVGQLLAASGRLWLGASMNLGWGLAFLCFAYLLRSHGAFGLASSRLLAYLLHATWSIAFGMYVLNNWKGVSSVQKGGHR
jgi:O-antigen/teichoic acid export membrane protein